MKIEVSEVKLILLKHRLQRLKLQEVGLRIENQHLEILREVEVEEHWGKVVNSR